MPDHCELAAAASVNASWVVIVVLTCRDQDPIASDSLGSRGIRKTCVSSGIPSRSPNT